MLSFQKVAFPLGKGLWADFNKQFGNLYRECGNPDRMDGSLRIQEIVCAKAGPDCHIISNALQVGEVFRCNETRHRPGRWQGERIPGGGLICDNIISLSWAIRAFFMKPNCVFISRV